VAAQAALLPALGDSDLRVVTRSAQAYERLVDDSLSKSDLFEQLEAALPRFPRSSTPLDPIVWPWMSLTADRATIAGQLLESLGQRPPSRLIPHRAAMGPYQRGRVVELLAKNQPWDAPTRETIFASIADLSPMVREATFKVLAESAP